MPLTESHGAIVSGAPRLEAHLPLLSGPLVGPHTEVRPSGAPPAAPWQHHDRSGCARRSEICPEEVADAGSASRALIGRLTGGYAPGDHVADEPGGDLSHPLSDFSIGTLCPPHAERVIAVRHHMKTGQRFQPLVHRLDKVEPRQRISRALTEV